MEINHVLIVEDDKEIREKNALITRNNYLKNYWQN